MDIHESGEGLYMHAPSLKEGYPQDSMPVWIVGRPYGLLAVHNIKGSPLKPNNRIGAVLACGGSPRMMSRPGVDRATYEAHPTFMPTHKLWEAWSWIDRGTAQWWPHWKNSALIRVTGTGEHYASLDRLTGSELASFRAGNVVVLYERSAGTSLCSAYHPPQHVRDVLGAGFDYVSFRPAADAGRHDLHLFRKPATSGASSGTRAR